jgi:hypothetical protein
MLDVSWKSNGMFSVVGKFVVRGKDGAKLASVSKATTVQHARCRQQGMNIVGGCAVFAKLIVATPLDGRQVPSEFDAGIFHDAAGFQAQSRDDLDPVGLGEVVVHVATMLDSDMKSISSFTARGCPCRPCRTWGTVRT